MASTISFRCRACNARIKAPMQMIGQTRHCPGCGCRIVVRVETPRDEGPMLVLEEQHARPHQHYR